MAKTLIIGVGNLLMGDDGVGIHAIRRLAEAGPLPPDVELMDGGTLGMNLLGYLEGVDRLILIDAMNTGQPPGALIRLADEQVPAYFALKISPHQVAIPDLLAAARLIDLYPRQVIVWGVQPQTIETGLELSPLVAAHLDTLVDNILAELSEAPEAAG